MMSNAPIGIMTPPATASQRWVTTSWARRRSRDRLAASSDWAPVLVAGAPPPAGGAAAGAGEGEGAGATAAEPGPPAPVGADETAATVGAFTSKAGAEATETRAPPKLAVKTFWLPGGFQKKSREPAL